jgi:hypothetical protein
VRVVLLKLGLLIEFLLFIVINKHTVPPMALEDLVSHQKIQEQVRKLVKQVSKQLGSMCVCKEVQVHYICGQAHVTCTIGVYQMSE